MSELHDVKIRGGICMWVPEIFKIENPADHFCWNSWHMSGIERKAIDQGFAFYNRCATPNCRATTASILLLPTLQCFRSARWTSTAI